MRVAHTVPSIASEAAGTTYVVKRMCENMQSDKLRASLICLGPESDEQNTQAWIRACPRALDIIPFINRLGFSPAMKSRLIEQDFDIYHSHGLWMMPNVYPSAAAKTRGKPLVVSPHGMLGSEALEYSAAIKKLFWLLAQKRAIEFAACLHATAHSEYEDIRAFGLKAPVAVIPNGIDLPKLEHAPRKIDKRAARTPYVLSLGRIHPKKALDQLVAAWAKLDEKYAHWRLEIVGPDELGCADQLKRQIQALGLEDKISINPPVFGDEKVALMREAELFVLSSRHENFAMTVAESLAVETPVVSTKGAPWSGLHEHDCGWWVGHGEDSLAQALNQALSLTSAQRFSMGRRGRDWMQRDFSWDNIAKQMLEVYQWLVNDFERPECVHTS